MFYHYQVYLAAIVGYVPARMVSALSAYLDFCYLVRRNSIDEDALAEIQEALERFHRDRVVFIEEKIRPDGISLPRQHALVHYVENIRKFGAPNGLCSSITESKHIKAVKEPWRRSNRWNALGQMLITNQRLDKLAAAEVDFRARGMLNKSLLADVLQRYGHDSENPLEDAADGTAREPALPSTSRPGTVEDVNNINEEEPDMNDGSDDRDTDLLGEVVLSKTEGMHRD